MSDFERRASSSLTFEDMTWPNPDDPAAVAWYLRYGTPTREHLLWAASVIGAYRQLIEVDQRTRATRVRQIRRARDEDWAQVEEAAENARAAAGVGDRRG